MKNDWRFFTTHDGISLIRNTELDEKNYYRMKIFMKNYFKDRYEENIKKQTSLLYSIVMSITGDKEGKENGTPYACDVQIDRRKIAISWTESGGVCVSAESREGNCIIRELYKILKDSSDNEFWKICL